MTIEHKTSLFQQEDQHLNSYQNRDIFTSPLKQTYPKQSFPKKLSEGNFNICTIILLAILIAAGGVTAYRYVELMNISKDLFLKNSAKMNNYEQDNFRIIAQSSQNLVKLNDPKVLINENILKQSVENPILIPKQDGNIQREEDKTKIPSQQNVQQHLQSQQNSRQNQNSNFLPTQDVSEQSISVSQNQKTSESNIDNTPGIKQISEISSSNENENLKKNDENHQYDQKQLFDPIMRVRQKIGQNLGVKFQDSPFIKKGTKITEDQYYKAKDRMQIWRYFNVRSKKYQLLPEGTQSLATVEQGILQKIQKIAKEQEDQIQAKYHVSQYEQIPFCIIIPSFKNADKYFRNLNSIFQQSYNKFHVIYIDDASNDGTAENVLSYIKKYEIPSHKLKFIENKQNKKALPNIDYAARNLCNSGQIMAIIDGDDYLVGRNVFSMINAQYQQEGLLALYTNHLRVHEPIYLKVGTCVDYPAKVKKARSYRHVEIFPASHLRTFYVDLYWRIKKRDLQDTRGQYFYAANDFAIMMPVLEMASDRFKYLPEITYIYDAGTGFNNFQTKTEMQARNFKTTKRRHKYPKLKNLDFVKYHKKALPGPQAKKEV